VAQGSGGPCAKAQRACCTKLTGAADAKSHDASAGRGWDRMPTRMNGFWGMLVGIASVLALLSCDHLFGIDSTEVFYVLLLAVNGLGGFIFGTLYHRARELSVLDSLTRVYNRNYFLPEFERQLSLAVRHGHPLSIVIVDLDRFKEHNDAFGHLQGDALLKEVASVLKACVRQSDTLARFGGDEFVLLLPHTDQVQAARLVQRLKERLAEAIPGKGVSLSAGIASFPEDGATPRDLLHRADLALYQAKEKRDTICRYCDVTPRPHAALAPRTDARWSSCD